MRASMARPEAHSLPALAPSAGGRALRQRRPSSGNHSIHRRQFAGLQRLQQQQRRGNDFSSAEARRDDELVVAASSSSGAAAAAAASSWPAAAGGSRRNNTTTTRASSTSASSATASMPSTSRGRELLDAIADLPWQRVGVWAVVAWAAYQLKDFFGVRRGRELGTGRD